MSSKSLDHLYISSSEDGVKSLFEGLNLSCGLQSLGIEYNHSLGCFFSQVVYKNQELKFLSLRFCVDEIKEQDFQIIAAGITGMKKLDKLAVIFSGTNVNTKHFNTLFDSIAKKKKKLSELYFDVKEVANLSQAESDGLCAEVDNLSLPFLFLSNYEELTVGYKAKND